MPDENAQGLIWKLVQEIGVCMLMTRDGDLFRARPMRGRAEPEENAIWFLSDCSNAKDDEIEAEPQVCLTYADPRENRYVSLSGRMEIIEDGAAMRQHWTEEGSAYFAHGAADPSAVLLKFTPERAEYWEAPSSALVIAIKFIEAQITGERPDLGGNAKAIMS